MASRAERERREANGLFREMMDQTRRHVRVGVRPMDGTRVELVGMAADLHGPDGLCTCCPRRARQAAS